MKLKAGLIAGFAATVVLSMFMIAKGMMGVMPQLNPIEDIVRVTQGLTGLSLPPPFGWVGHFVLGTVLWGFLYAALQARVPGTPVVKGLIFGVAAWLVMMIVFMPLSGHGMFAMSLGPQAAMATLVLHLIFGAVLGLVYAKVARGSSGAGGG